jgi:hypothetical protein
LTVLGQDVAAGCSSFINNLISSPSSLPFVKNCGSDQSGTAGFFASPNYPNNYNNGSACVWSIAAPAGSYLSLTFFAVIDPSDRLFFVLPQNNCSSATNTTYFTSIVPRQTIVIKQNTLAVYFHSDATVSNSGFQISWSSFMPVGTPPAICTQALGYGSFVKNCGSDLTGTSGTIQSANYPNAYNVNATCHWYIQAPAGTVITLNITAFYTEYFYDCFHALVPPTCSHVIGKCYSGRQTPQAIYFLGNSASLFFKSDNVINYSGFNINWYATPTCVDAVRSTLPPSEQVPLPTYCTSIFLSIF